jgi:hypothetical protein
MKQANQKNNFSPGHGVSLRKYTGFLSPARYEKRAENYLFKKRAANGQLFVRTRLFRQSVSRRLTGAGYFGLIRIRKNMK